jgi:2-oxoglutarate/2-oxoacid ferredoxin oxidoreductase subunit alpha
MPETSPSNGGRKQVAQHIVEIVSDSGEGAQKAGQSFGAVSAKMGNGVWTVEIIPAEIKPPARSRAGASGIRVRLGSKPVTNMGDEADLVIAFNEQVLYGRITQGAFRPGTIILLENKWKEDKVEKIRQEYATAVAEFRERGFVVHELALEKACLEHTPNPALGKNMFVLGMLCHIYDRSLQPAFQEVRLLFKKKGEEVIARNVKLIQAGYDYAKANIEYRWQVPAIASREPQVVMNGNQAVGLGVMAAGMELVSMYPITPATSASHYLASVFDKVGGCVHQAEDEIAAIGFAVGASYAGKTACTITSGPGLALKTEFVGLAVMAEVPLVIVVVQRGGPATGLPTKVEQGDLLTSLYGAPGDAPKVVIAASTIAECFEMVITARKIAEAFRTPVLVLTDANLATGVSPFPRPKPCAEWLAPPVDQSPWTEGVAPYDWDDKTGLSPRPIPGQPGGEYVLTGLAHTRESKVAYDPESNQLGCDMRSKKLAALKATLTPPVVHGDPEGDLLVIGWGSTLGAIEEAVDRARARGLKVSSLHIRFLSPLEPGLDEIFKRFKRVMTVEINYSDSPAENGARRYAQLAWLLRAQTLCDIDCWSQVQGQPISPGLIYEEIVGRMSERGREQAPAGRKDEKSCSV